MTYDMIINDSSYFWTMTITIGIADNSKKSQQLRLLFVLNIGMRIFHLTLIPVQ